MRTRPTLRALGLVALALALVVSVRALGSGALAAPPLSSVDALSDWVSDSQPAGVAMSLLRLGAEIVAWYLVLVASVLALATITRAASLRRLTENLAAPLPRRLARLAIGVTLATTASPTALSGDQLHRSAPPTTMVALSDGASAAATTMRSRGGPSEEVAVGRPLPSPGVAVGGPVDPDDVAVGGPSTRVPTPRIPEVTVPETPGTWTVATGESFWVIAAETVSDLLGRPATDDEIAPYWTALIDANRHRLVDPENPDLILPGQVFELPETSRP